MMDFIDALFFSLVGFVVGGLVITASAHDSETEKLSKIEAQNIMIGSLTKEVDMLRDLYERCMYEQEWDK